MIRYPAAEYRPLGVQTEPRMAGHDVVCLHTMVGYLSSTDRYFRSGNGAGYQGTESHFGVGGKWGGDAVAGLDGTVWQWQDLAHQADANLGGNPTTISIETADNAARPIQPWTPAQVESLAQLVAWLCARTTHADCPPSWTCHREGIPLSLIPDTLPGRRGIGYHRQGCDPWRVEGGVRWSPSTGKDCPTEARIQQIPAIIARAIEITQEDDMATPGEIAAAVWAAPMDGDTMGNRVYFAHRRAQAAVDELAKVRADLAALAAKVEALSARTVTGEVTVTGGTLTVGT